MNNNSIIGNTYNYLTVLRRVDDHITSGGNKFPAYECRCVCGRHKVVVAAKLKNGHVKSCGQCGIFSTKKDLSGKRFDKLFVIRENGYYEYPNGERDYKWLCRCDCGNYVMIRGNSLKSEGNHNCGCYRKQLRITDDDMIGKRFGMLVVLSRAESRYTRENTLVNMWTCLCDCGNVVVTAGARLRNGNCRSCGCGHMSFNELLLRDYFDSHDFTYETQVSFPNLYGFGGGLLLYDFLLKYNNKSYLIETNGRQHYEPIEFFGGLSSYYYTVYHDALKRMYAEANGYVYVAIDCDRKSDENIIEQLKQQVGC